MSRRTLVSIFLIFTTSLLSCIDLSDKYMAMEDSCELEIRQNSVNPCCCNENHNNYQISPTIELPVIVSGTLEVIHDIFIYKYKDKYNDSLIVSSFYTPLNTIRLLI